MQSLAFSALVRWLLPLKQRDTQAGLKGLSAAAAQTLLPRLSCDGFGFDCELLTACRHYGLTVEEVPVCVRYEDRRSTTAGEAPATPGFRPKPEVLRMVRFACWQSVRTR